MRNTPCRTTPLLANLLCTALLCTSLAACRPAAAPEPEHAGQSATFERTGFLRDPRLPEMSGLIASSDGNFWAHNDSGAPELHLFRPDGALLATVVVEGARNRDWEDATAIPAGASRAFVIGDIGDNEMRHERVELYVVPEPQRGPDGNYPGRIRAQHRVEISYPDGPHDCEALAYDSREQLILLLTKRDNPPRLYSVPVAELSNRERVTATALGELTTLRPPTPVDLLKDPSRGGWVSQPTGLDISADGQWAAVLTYRSLYLYRREAGEHWPQVFRRKPQEFVGPPGTHDEGVAFDRAGTSLLVVAEGVPAPIHRLRLPASGGLR